MQHTNEIIKDPSVRAEADVERNKRNTHDMMCIATDPVLNEKTREKESGSAAEETVPDVREAPE